MEKVGNCLIEGFPSATLFLDDLVEIASLFSHVCREIEIRAGDYKLSNLNEISELASKYPDGRFDDVYINGYDPYISIDFRTHGIRGYISEDTVEQRGLIAQILNLVQKRKKLHPGFLTNSVTCGLAASGSWLASTKHYVSGISLLALSFIFISVGNKYQMRNVVIIRSTLRNSYTPFFKRKKDELLLVGISAFLGGLITYLFTKLHS